MMPRLSAARDAGYAVAVAEGVRLFQSLSRHTLRGTPGGAARQL